MNVVYRTVSEATAALDKVYDGPTKKVKGDGGKEYDYISWDDSARQFDAVFGPLGWSHRVLSSGSPMPGVYHCTAEITARVVDDETGAVIEITRAGTGVGVAEASYEERQAGHTVSPRLKAHDTAIKGAESDAFSRTAKKFGSAFGLDLYKKPGGTQASSNSSNGNGATASANPFQTSGTSPTASKGPKVGNASQPQANMMRKNGWSDGQIAALTYDQVRQVMDGLFNKGPKIDPASVAAASSGPELPY